MTELHTEEPTGNSVAVTDKNGKKKVFLEQTNVRSSTLIACVASVGILLSSGFAAYYNMVGRIDAATYKRWNQDAVVASDQVRKAVDPGYPALSIQQVSEIAELTAAP